MRGARFLAVLPALAACAGPARLNYKVAIPEARERLANGMRVILLPDSTSDLVQVDVRYEVGAADDPPAKAGLAHLVEHLRFDHRPGGPQAPPLIAGLRERAAYFNAFSALDYTQYTTLARREALDTVLEVEAGRLRAGCRGIDEA